MDAGPAAQCRHLAAIKSILHTLSRPASVLSRQLAALLD
jgi:hypothetical protein